MSVASKNLFELLGNDDGDSDNVAPVKTVDKNTTRTVKRNTDGEGPANKGAGASARRAGPTGNDGAFRDRGAGSDRNRVKSTDDGAPRGGGFRGGRNARVRGGPGARFPRDRDDRHNKSGPGGGSDKQAAQGWGATEGEAEMKDEQAGEEIAKKDEKDAAAEDAEGGAREEYPAEPEDKSVSYADYLAEQTEKKLALEHENTLKVRKPNEGSKQNKQWAAAKPLVKEEDDEFISGSGGKVKRERERKTKQLVEIDNRYIEPDRPRGGGGGGRGGSRGGRGESSRGGPRGDGRGGGGRGGGPRGEYRGGRGGGGDRGDRSDRGDRGGRGENRGDYRGGRGGGRGGGQGLNTNDETAFPTLGS